MPPDPSADRNLLFGVLALQADLLDAERFAEACSAWAARKDTPLPDLLVERGWLTAEDRADIEKLLKRKLAKHGGDASAGLAEVAGPALRNSLAAHADPAVHQSVADLFATHYSDPVVSDGAGRHQRLWLHAEGGIGQVWRAYDTRLNREVALKELQPDRAGHPHTQARFLEEARVTGQLEHPNIVPIHELVHDGSGTPFYTMRLVKTHVAGIMSRDPAAHRAGPGPAVAIGCKIGRHVRHAAPRERPDDRRPR